MPSSAEGLLFDPKSNQVFLCTPAGGQACFGHWLSMVHSVSWPLQGIWAYVSDLSQVLWVDCFHLACPLIVFAPFLLSAGCIGNGERCASLRKQMYAGRQVEKVKEDIYRDSGVTGSAQGWEIQQKQSETSAVAVSLVLWFASQNVQSSIVLLVWCRSGPWGSG